MMRWKQQKNLLAAGYLRFCCRSQSPVYPSVPWKDRAGIWDKLIRAYFGVNLKVVWLSVKEGIPEAKPDIKRILDEM